MRHTLGLDRWCIVGTGKLQEEGEGRVRVNDAP